MRVVRRCGGVARARVALPGAAFEQGHVLIRGLAKTLKTHHWETKREEEKVARPNPAFEPIRATPHETTDRHLAAQVAT